MRDNRANDRAEGLSIRNVSFFINANLATAPQGVMLRELFQNALEADVSEGEQRRLIRLYATPEGKLAIINSGLGMSEAELLQATDFSQSVGKRMGLKGRENRGEGAKIAGLPFNPLGMRYRSRKGTGTDEETFSEAVILYDEDIGWSRKLVDIDPDGFIGAYPVDDEELTPDETERYSQFRGDFTEVVLFGKTADQRTAYDPYGNGKEGERQSVPNEIFARYYTFPNDLGIPIVVQADGPSFRDGADFRPIVPAGSLIASYSSSFENYKERFVTLQNGVKLEFVKTKTVEKNRTPWNTKSMGRNGGRAALVWKHEMYDVLEDDRSHYKAWSRAAPSFGLTGLAAEISLFIHIPEDWDITDGRYRNKLMFNNGKEINIRDFEGDVVANRPDWVKALLNTTRSNPSTMNDVYDELRKYAASLSVKAEKGGRNFVVIHGGQGSGQFGGSPSGSRTNNGKQQNAGGSATGGNSPGSGAGSRSNTDGTRRARAKNGAGEALRLTVPMPVWFDNSRDNPDLEGRGADFRLATTELHLNREYPVYHEMIDTIFSDYILAKHPTAVMTAEMRILISSAVEVAIAKTVGRAVLLALHKRGVKGWSPAAVNAALTTEALSIAYDLAIESVGSIAHSLQTRADFKGALAEATLGSIAA